MAYTSWSVTFGEQPSAAKWNILGTNDASFNDGTGIADGAVTPAKRSGGFRTGTMTPSVSATFAVTGVGFQPKLLRFIHLRTASSTVASQASGGTDGTRQWATFSTAASGLWQSDESTSKCLLLKNASGTTLQDAAIVSLDADGFTLNVATASASYGGVWAYEAYA